MSSTFKETDLSSNASEDNFNDAQLLSGQLARDSRGAVQYSDGTLDQNESGRVEREAVLHAYAKEHGVTLEYDKDGLLQPIYPRMQSGIFKDRPSPALWRHRTTFERDIAADLVQARSSDLSLHLYNTSMMRQRLSSQIPDESGFVETKDPPRAWATWPMTPDTVPRDSQPRVREDEDWRRGPYVKIKRKPGDELRELLTARAIKTGKERFLLRESESSSSGDEEDKILRPVVGVDDDRAGLVLRPSIQHVLAKLDRLLVALHRARSSTISPVKSRRKRKESRTNPSHSSAASESDERSTLFIDDDDDLRESSNFKPEINPSKRPKRQKKLRQDKNEKVPVRTPVQSLPQKALLAGLRDWTDVIGVAMMAGIGSAVINKTGLRCSDLFDARKDFRVISGGLTNSKETFYLPHSDTFESANRLRRQDAEMHDGVHVDGFMQPIKGTSHWKAISRKRKERKVVDQGLILRDDREGNTEVGFESEYQDNAAQELDDEIDMTDVSEVGSTNGSNKFHVQSNDESQAETEDGHGGNDEDDDQDEGEEENEDEDEDEDESENEDDLDS